MARRDAVAALWLAAATALASWTTRDMPRYGDETHHLREIRRLCAGDTRVDRRLTTIPGYHALSALVGRATGDCSLPRMRIVNAAFGFLSALAFLAALRETATKWPLERLIQYYFLPILFPYHFLLYTDSLSLLSVLLVVLALLKRRPVTAGMLGCLSLLVRQTNVVWLGFVALYVWMEPGPALPPRERVLRCLRQTWPCLLGAAAFTGFVLWNGGVALHDKSSHPLGLYSGNVFFSLGVFALLFLPHNLAALWRERDRLLDRRVVAWVVVAVALFALAFRADHPYNRFGGFLRNDALAAIETSLLARGALLAGVALAVASLAVTPLQRVPFLALYPAALASLLPAWLVEHRYYFVPYVLFLLFRRDDAAVVERLSATLASIGAVAVLYGVSRGLIAL